MILSTDNYLQRSISSAPVDVSFTSTLILTGITLKEWVTFEDMLAEC